jgi:Ca2+-binding RTX toxin-like protein
MPSITLSPQLAGLLVSLGVNSYPDVHNDGFPDAFDDIIDRLNRVDANKWGSYVGEAETYDARAAEFHLLGGYDFHTGSLAAETFLFTDKAFTVDTGGGANTVTGGSGNNFVKTGLGADTINLTSGNNVIISEAGANVVNLTYGNNFIITGLGADNITATSGNNIIDAGDGANTITVTSGNNTIITGAGADNITTAGGESTINTIKAGDGANTITTGAGEDHITGGINADTISSGAGNDTVFAGAGANTITTGGGNDVIHTGVDVDTVTAGLGEDIIHVYGGTDTIAAGAGTDTLIVHFGGGAAGSVSINSLSGTLETGYSGNVSGLGAATFLGVENFHIISGGAKDMITTGGGADIIVAGGGDDFINGGGGDDTLTGGLGADEFIYDRMSTGTDTITDFSGGNSQGDTLVFVDCLNDNFKYIAGDPFSNGGNSEARFDSGSVLVDSNGDGQTDFTIKIEGMTVASYILESDFIFI